MSLVVSYNRLKGIRKAQEREMEIMMSLSLNGESLPVEAQLSLYGCLEG